MKKDFRQSMTWLHSWAGLLVCWVLYFMFVTGTVGYYDTEIDHWMKPELPMNSYQGELSEQALNQRIELGINYLENNVADAERWFIRPGNDLRAQDLNVSWRWPRGEIGLSNNGEKRKNGRKILSPLTGEAITSRDTKGGQSLYQMHYQLHYLTHNTGFRIIAICTLFMFLGLVTGTIAHRKIFKEFFTFRPDKGKSAWLDFHKLSGVASLPFQLMITYSGLIFATTALMPFVILGSYGFDTKTVRAETQALRQRMVIEASGNDVALSKIKPLLQEVRALWGPDKIRQIEIKHPGDSNARVIFDRKKSLPTDQRNILVFDGGTGELLSADPKPKVGSLITRTTFTNLHLGLFASPVLRILYFLFGVLGAAMVGSGAIYWATKRRKLNHQPSFGHKLVEVLNIGTIAGLPIAIAGYFLANRLLPVEMNNRADWEMHSLFIIWVSCFALVVFRGRQQSWLDLTAISSLIFISVPIINGITTDAHLLNSFAARDWARFGVDAACIFCCLISACLYLRLRINNGQAINHSEVSP